MNLTVAQACARLGLTRAQLKRLRMNGTIQAFAFGRKYLFPVDAVKAFEKGRRANKGDVRKLRPAVAPDCQRHVYQARATPPWADKVAIAAIYAECRRRSAETGVPHHVDHEVPLRSELVCGLHVPANLRIVEKTVNKRKSNRFDVMVGPE